MIRTAFRERYQKRSSSLTSVLPPLLMKSLTFYYSANYFLLKFTQETRPLIQHPVPFDGKVISALKTRTSWKILRTNYGYNFHLIYKRSIVLNYPVHDSGPKQDGVIKFLFRNVVCFQFSSKQLNLFLV